MSQPDSLFSSKRPEGLPRSKAVNRILAIDGPAGAGKSTIAARMAARFGLLHLETGAMYRAFALKALTSGISIHDAAALTQLAAATQIELLANPAGNRVLLDTQDVTSSLRTPHIAEAASQVSVHAPVRAWLVGLQQQMGRGVAQGIVMEGRDIGTVVFPDASVKIFLSASAEARSNRRLAQSEAANTSAASVLASIRERDARDQSRAASPLKPAEDAIVVDSTQLSLDAVSARIEAFIVERWGV